MWLDRLSGNSTPSGSPPPPHNRSYSPAARHHSGLGPGGTSRPAFGPRTSSLNIHARANLSIASINSPRLPNGSALKRQVSPPADSTDPLKALEAIVGRSLSEEGNESTQHGLVDGIQGPNRPTELLAEIDFEGLNLEDFAQTSHHGPEYGNIDIETTTQTVEECEYVCTISRALV